MVDYKKQNNGIKLKLLIWQSIIMLYHPSWFMKLAYVDWVVELSEPNATTK
jgi:hypothetical protein